MYANLVLPARRCRAVFVSSVAAAQAEPHKLRPNRPSLPLPGSRELRDDVRAAIKASDRVTKQNRDDVVRRLVAVHERVKQSQVTGDERDTLERRVEAQLAHLADLIQRQMAREAAAPNVGLPAADAPFLLNRDYRGPAARAKTPPRSALDRIVRQALLFSRPTMGKTWSN